METRRFLFDSYAAPGDSFRAEIKRVGSQRPRYRHDHDFHELMVLLDGTLRHDVGGRSDILAPGAAVFLRPLDAHAVYAPKGHHAHILNIMARSDLIAALGARHGDTLAGRFFWSNGVYPDGITLRAAVRDRVVQAGSLLRDGPATALRLEAFFTNLLTDLTTEGAIFDLNLPDWLARACRTAQTPDVFREGAAGLARVAGRSHEHLCRAMRRHLDTTPSAWINSVRMEHAARLIREGTLPVADVAEAVGIGNVGHFYRLFRDQYGTTPRAYRERARRAPV